MSSPATETSAVVVGAGVVGLACAAALARTGRDVIVIERDVDVGRGGTSRNSEVVHAGLYYPTGSLKARLCVRGNRLLYEACERLGIPCRRTGKLVVAMRPEEEPELERLLALGGANGVELTRLSAKECRRLEPHVCAVAGLLSPSTGIVSAHGPRNSWMGRVSSYPSAGWYPFSSPVPVNRSAATRDRQK